MPIQERHIYNDGKGGDGLESELVFVHPGETAIIEGRNGTYSVHCNPDDDGGMMTVLEAATDVIVGGLFGLNGLFGSKITTRINHSKSVDVRLSNKHGGSERVNLEHISPKYPKVRI